MKRELVTGFVLFTTVMAGEEGTTPKDFEVDAEREWKHASNNIKEMWCQAAEDIMYYISHGKLSDIVGKRKYLGEE